MSYLNLVLFDRHGRSHVTPSRQLLSPLLADSLVELYVEHRPEQLTNFLLHSWVKNYSPGMDKFCCGKMCMLIISVFVAVHREGIGTVEQKFTKSSSAVSIVTINGNALSQFMRHKKIH